MKHQFSIVLVCLIFVVFSAAVTMADLTEDLVAFWPLDEGSGTVARDLSGNDHNGTLADGPTWTPPGEFKMGKGALAFDGADDRVSIDSFDVVDGSGITLAAWIKPNSFNDDGLRVLSKASSSSTSDHYWALVLAGNDLHCRLRTDVGATSKVTVPDEHALEAGVWVHAAVTWDASDPNMRFYKNGEEIHSASKPGAAIGAGPDVKIGMGNQSVSAGEGAMDRPFDGILDDVGIWNRALTQDEIFELMTNGIPTAVEPGGKLTATWGAIKH